MKSSQRHFLRLMPKMLLAVCLAATAMWFLRPRINNQAAQHYLQRLQGRNLEFRDAIIEYRRGTNQRWFSFTAQGSSVLIRSADSRRRLRDQKFFLVDGEELVCQTGDGFWRCDPHPSMGGFIETDYDSILDPKTVHQGAHGTEVRFSSQSRNGELLWLGIPDYWARETQSQSNGFRWTGRLGWTGHEPFVSALFLAGNVVTNLIERPAAQDRYRKQLRIIRFGTKSEWPESMEAFSVIPDGTLEPMFTLRLHSISKFRPRDLSQFLMSNHVAFNSIGIVSLKKGVKTSISLPNKPWNFVLVEGIPIPFFALWILAAVAVFIGAILLIPFLGGRRN